MIGFFLAETVKKSFLFSMKTFYWYKYAKKRQKMPKSGFS